MAFGPKGWQLDVGAHGADVELREVEEGWGGMSECGSMFCVT